MDILKKVKITEFNKNSFSNKEDEIVVESYIKIVVNGEHYISIASTPSDIKYLAVGHLFTDGIINNYQDIKNIKTNTSKLLVEINLQDAKKIVKSNRLMTTGFGKGSVTLNAMKEEKNKFTSEYILSPEYILNKMNDFNNISESFVKTGGIHSSCLCLENDKSIFMEDIGRHNAVDKIIGYVLFNNIDINEGVLFTTGRLSSEIVSKVYKLGIPVLISRSAATDKAFEMAEKCNMTLIGFVRNDRFVIYNSAGRI